MIVQLASLDGNMRAFPGRPRGRGKVCDPVIDTLSIGATFSVALSIEMGQLRQAEVPQNKHYCLLGRAQLPLTPPRSSNIQLHPHTLATKTPWRSLYGLDELAEWNTPVSGGMESGIH